MVGPLIWEPPSEPVEPPPGDAPLVLVAPSTAQDPDHRLLRAALAGLGGEPIRVLATWNRRPLPGPAPVPANTRLVEWISYAQTMPGCDAGHLPRRPRHPGAGAGLGSDGARRPPRRRHGRERRPGRLGRRRRPAALAAAQPADAAPGRRRALGSPERAAAPAARRRLERTRRGRAADLVEELALSRGGRGA